MEGDNEEESFVWNEETEDPLGIDPLQSSEINDSSSSQKVIVKKEPVCSELEHRVIKTEPNCDYQDKSFEPSCSSTLIEDHLSNEMMSNADVQDSPIRLFPCKMCKKPYRMVCGSNLTIRGYCNDCLYSSDKGQSQNMANASWKCSVCDEKFSDVKHLNAHLKLMNTCSICDKKFCNVNEFKKHLLQHDGMHKNEVNPCSVKDVPSNNGIEALEKHVKLFINTISDDLVQSDVLMDEEISGKVPVKPKKEKPCKKLSSEVNKNPALDQNFRKSRCLLCSKLLPKELLSDHMSEEHSTSFHQSGELSKSLPSKSCEEKVKPNLLCNLSSQGRGGEKMSVTPCKSESIKHLNRVSLSPVSSSSIANHDKNEAKLSFCRYEYVCELCDVKYDDLNLLKEHIVSDMHVNMIVIIVGINLSCKLCKASFDSISDLKSHLIQDSHIVNYHIKKTEVSLFCCQICNKTFISESDFQIHELLEGHQLKDKKNGNNFCRDKTPDVKQEKVATRRETQEKDKGCDNEQENVTVYPVKQQEKVVRKNTEQSKEQLLRTCKTCNKVFSVLSALKTHVKNFKHKPYIAFNNVKASSNPKVVVTGPKEDMNDEKVVNENRKNGTDDHRCKKCNKLFSSIYNVRRHAIVCGRNPVGNKLDASVRLVNIESDQNTYDCKVCGKMFEKESSLKGHFLSSHSQYSQFEISPAKVKQKHYKSNKETYKCKVCNRTYEHKWSLQRHILNHHSNESQSKKLELSSPVERVIEENLFQCKVCRKSYTCETSLKRHCTSKKHKMDFATVECKTELSSPVESVIEENLFQCKVCHKSFSCGTSLKKHCTFNKHKMDFATVERKTDFVKCKVCLLKFNCLGDLLFHYCYKRHNVHSKIRVNCKCCNKTFKQLFLYINHARRQHHVAESLKTYNDSGSCKLCHVKCKDLSALKAHIISNYHIGMYVKHLFNNNKMKKCYVNANLNSATSVSSTNNINENCNLTSVISSSKIHKCKYCNKLFNHNFLLNRHIKMHEKAVLKPFKCFVCHKRCSNRAVMAKHVKDVHGVKEHACPICERRFTYPYQVRLHISSHDLDKL